MIREWTAERRRAVADVLDGLTADQWAAPSLCDGWTVAHVAAHVTMVLDGLVSARSLRHFGVAVDGVALQATDVGWSSGEGRPLAARGTDLVLLLAGRRVPGERFEGDPAPLAVGGRR